MRPPAVFVLSLSFLGCVNELAPPQADSGSTNATATASAPASASSVASASSSIDWGAIGDTTPLLPVELPPVAAAPLPASASEAQRTAAVLDLLSGGEPATRLAIRATDGDKAFDHALRQKVAPLSRSKPPSVRMGATSVSAGLPPEVVQRIVRQNFGRFRLCYENGLRNNPHLAGRVKVNFAIDAKGAVQSPTGGGDMPDSAVIACVTKAFYGLSFPAPEGGVVVKVTYPIAFAPGS